MILSNFSIQIIDLLNVINILLKDTFTEAM